MSTRKTSAPQQQSKGETRAGVRSSNPLEARSALYGLLPSIREVDHYLKARDLHFGKPVRAHVNGVLDGLREEISASINPPPLEGGARGGGLAEGGEPAVPPLPFSSKEQILEHLAAIVRQRGQISIRRVINATGVVIHTNLGRAPISRKLIDSILPLLSSYATVEYDLESGKRGTRGEGVRNHLRFLSGAEDALVVNNNAAALYLMLVALAYGKEVIVSRGELMEIGGSFRVPDIMRAAGVRLVEVGTTNRTRLSDYEKAINGNTAALLKVHPSNYEMRGFVEETPVAQISRLAREHELFAFHDLGSGNFYQFEQPALRGISTVQWEVRSGVDLLTFSGDKLLGSTQAGIVVGRKNLIRRLARHPLFRVLRLDKITMALLEVHLAAYFQMETLASAIPTIGLLEQSSDAIRQKAETVLRSLSIPPRCGWSCKLAAAASLSGGGALPEIYLDSYCLVLEHVTLPAEKIQQFFRQQEIPVIARVRNNQVWLDFRTVFPEEFPLITRVLHQLFAAQ